MCLKQLLYGIYAQIAVLRFCLCLCVSVVATVHPAIPNLTL